MTYRLLIVVSAVLVQATASCAAAELPTYEVQGLPITPHQMAVLGAANAGQALGPSIGMPASPHQIAVLTPRKQRIAPPTIGKSLVGFAVEAEIASERSR
jgi:hypothetical protein